MVRTFIDSLGSGKSALASSVLPGAATFAPILSSGGPDLGPAGATAVNCDAAIDKLRVTTSARRTQLFDRQTLAAMIE